MLESDDGTGEFKTVVAEFGYMTDAKGKTSLNADYQK